MTASTSTPKKLRKVLPSFAVVRGLQIDTSKLLRELDSHGLFQKDYTAASSAADNAENLFIKANMVCKQFFNANDDKGYSEINLSKPSYRSDILKEADVQRDVFATYRTKRLDPRRPEYSEHADETLHNIDPAFLAPGTELEKLFQFFRGKPCRVRIARMTAGFHIRPHVDYDPSYIFRYHIPLMTNEKAQLHANREGVRYGQTTQSVHMPADGHVYWINTGVMHWADNQGTTDRYHLLIDVTGDKEFNNMEYLEPL